MLILAGVTIATLTGDNGILTRAQEAKTKTDEASDIEKIRLAISEAQIGENGYQELDANNLQKAIDSQFGGRDAVVSDNEDRSFLVNMNDTQRMYYIGENGEIIDQSKMLKISTGDELKAFRDDVNNGNTYEGKYVYLTNDIILDINEEWIPIGLYPSISNGVTDSENNKPFKGIFDGKGFEIDGIYINTTERGQGLFGFIEGATIKNLGIGESCNISGGTATGGVAGYIYNNSRILNSYNSTKCWRMVIMKNR